MMITQTHPQTALFFETERIVAAHRQRRDSWHSVVGRCVRTFFSTLPLAHRPARTPGTTGVAPRPYAAIELVVPHCGVGSGGPYRRSTTASGAGSGTMLPAGGEYREENTPATASIGSSAPTEGVDAVLRNHGAAAANRRHDRDGPFLPRGVRPTRAGGCASFPVPAALCEHRRQNDMLPYICRDS